MKGANFTSAIGSPLHFQVTKKTDLVCEIQPLLMNPGEWFRVEVYTADQPPSATASSDDLDNLRFAARGDVTWSCHIADVKCPADRFFEMDSPKRWDVMDALGFTIIRIGWSVWLLVGFIAVNILLLAALANRPIFHRRNVGTGLKLTALAIFILSSLNFSNGLTEWIVDGNCMWCHSWPAKIGYAVHILLVWFLAVDLIDQINKRKKRSDRNRGISGDGTQK